MSSVDFIRSTLHRIQYSAVLKILWIPLRTTGRRCDDDGPTAIKDRYLRTDDVQTGENRDTFAQHRLGCRRLPFNGLTMMSNACDADI